MKQRCGCRERVAGCGAVTGGGELGRYEQRDYTARRGQLHGALEERDGEVRPVAEPRARAAPPPVSSLEPPAHLGGHVLGAKPWGVPGNDAEATGREDIRELTPVLEPRHLSLAGDGAPRGRERAQLGPGSGEQRSELAIHASPLAEEIDAPCRPHMPGDLCPELRFGSLERLGGGARLRRAELPYQLALGRPGGDDQALAQPRDRVGQPRIGTPDPGHAARLEQTVALAYETIEVRQRLDPLGALLPIIRDDGEPEAELGETNRRRTPVDPEEIALENPAASGRVRHAVGRGMGREQVEGAQQECTRPDGGIEHRDIVERGARRALAVGQPPLRFGLAAAEPPRHRRGQRGLEQRADQSRRGVVGARGSARVPRHHALEHPAQHVRRDAARLASLGDGEVKPLEQPVECVSPDGVGNVAAEGAFDAMRLEQATVQEGDGSESGRAAAPLGGRAVERAEEEWTEQVTVDAPPARQAAVHLFGEELFSAGEPPFGLDEIEEEDTGELEQRQAASVLAARPIGHALHHPLERCLELAEEAAPDLLSAQRVGSADCVGQRAARPPRGEPAERGDGGAAWVIELHFQRRRTVERDGHAQPPCGRIEGQYSGDPPPGGEPPRHSARQPFRIGARDGEPGKITRAPDGHCRRETATACRVRDQPRNDGVQRFVAQGCQQPAQIFDSPDSLQQRAELHAALPGFEDRARYARGAPSPGSIGRGRNHAAAAAGRWLAISLS